jgi:hypothetical protein
MEKKRIFRPAYISGNDRADNTHMPVFNENNIKII